MINILYSLLVAGSRDIPETSPMYRKHSKLDYVHPGILSSSDPHRKSIYANYIIGLAKLSSLYGDIIKIDKSNTYNVSPITARPYINTTNCIILKQSNICPVIECSFDPTESGVIGILDGDNFIAEYIDDTTFKIYDMTVKVIDTNNHGSISMYVPGIGISAPTRSSVSKYLSDIPRESLDTVDLNTPWDCAGVLCLSALKRYTRNVII